MTGRFCPQPGARVNVRARAIARAPSPEAAIALRAADLRPPPGLGTPPRTPWGVMRWSFGIGRLFGIPVRVHLGLVLLLLVLVALAPSDIVIVRTLLMSIIVLASLVLHELVHALVARRHGIETKQILLHPLGGAAMLSDRPPTPVAEVLIAGAAPFANLAVAGLAFAGAAVTDAELLRDIAWPNLLLGATNLVPAFPLDGGRMLRAGLELKLGPIRATRWAARLGRVLATAAVAVGLAFAQPVLVVIGAMIFLAGTAEERTSIIHTFMSRRRVHESMDGIAQSVSAGGDVADALRLLGEHPRVGALPVTFGERVIGVVYREPLLLAAARGPETSISEILDRNIVTHEGDGPLVPLLKRMGESQSRTAVITQDHEVLGVITVDRLIEALRAARD